MREKTKEGIDEKAERYKREKILSLDETETIFLQCHTITYIRFYLT